MGADQANPSSIDQLSGRAGRADRDTEQELKLLSPQMEFLLWGNLSSALKIFQLIESGPTTLLKVSNLLYLRTIGYRC